MTGKSIETRSQPDRMAGMVAAFDQFVTVAEAADMIGVSVQRVHALIKEQPPRLSRIFRGGRYELLREEVQRFAASDRRTGRPAKKSSNRS